MTPNEPKPSTVYFYITPLDQHTCRVFSHALVCDPIPKPISWLLSKRPRWLDHLVLNEARHACSLPGCVLGFDQLALDMLALDKLASESSSGSDLPSAATFLKLKVGACLLAMSHCKLRSVNMVLAWVCSHRGVVLGI